MTRTKTSTALSATALVLFGAPAAAHERWVRHRLLNDFDRSLFETFTPLNLGTLAAVVCLAACLIWVSARMTRSSSSNRFQPWTAAIVGICFSAGMLVAASHGSYAAPDLVAEDTVMGQGLIGLTVASSVLLLLGLWARAAGLLAVALFLAALLIRPFAEFDGKSVPLANVLNYLNVGGAALFLALMGRGSASLDSLRKKGAPLVGLPRERAVGLLRLSLGAALVILGVQKFLLPELPMGVVQNYADEVYIPLHKLTGISPESYVFAAAMVEASVGLLIMAGVFTRALMVVLIGLFTLTAFIFEGEVLGHLPILGAVLALLIEGGGAFRVDSWFSPRAAAEVDDSPQADQPPRRARLGVLDPA